MPGLSPVTSDPSFSPVSPNSVAAPRPHTHTDSSADTTCNLNGPQVAIATPVSSRIAINVAPLADVAPQEGVTEQQHRFDTYLGIEATTGVASLGLGVGTLKITCIAILLGAHAPAIGIGLVAFGAATLLNTLTDLPFRPNY